MDRLLDSLFPTADSIPETWRLGGPLEQREYLVNGQLRRWEGPLATVRSPVWLKPVSYTHLTLPTKRIV